MLYSKGYKRLDFPLRYEPCITATEIGRLQYQFR